MASSLQIPCHFECALEPSDKDIVIHSPLLLNWVEQVQKTGTTLSKLNIQSVDFVGQVRRPLFVKLRAELRDPQGRTLPGIVVLRGHAVAVLPVLQLEGEDFVVLVEQARIPAAQLECLEIPAGMCDGGSDFAAIACKELKEETGLVCAESDLESIYQNLDWIDASPGLLDEGIKLFLYRRTSSPAEIETMRTSHFGNAEENEYIKIHVLPVEEALTKVRDSKTMLALALYLLRKKELP